MILIHGCAGPQKGEVELKPVSFDTLPGWGQDNLKDFDLALAQSCQRIMKRGPDLPFGKDAGKDAQWGRYGDWQNACNAVQKDLSIQTIEKFFQPYAVNNNARGLFTGYYEASLRGSRNRYGPYQTPLYERPSDLVMVNLGAFRDDLKGRRIAGRVKDGRLHPYESREEIVSGKLPPSQKNVLVWVDSPVDAFFVQIQGSGVVELDNEDVMRIGYAGQNGHPYYAIGRELVKRGDLRKQDVSLQSIRAWLSENPGEAEDVMNTNASYVFFRELQEGPIGGEGVPLTAQRSLAVDHSLMPYGFPVWVDLDHPEEGQGNLRRLMMAQDTGGAIRGPVRGDYFWGYGEGPENLAGKMKSQGRYWFLLPRKGKQDDNQN